MLDYSVNRYWEDQPERWNLSKAKRQGNFDRREVEKKGKGITLDLKEICMSTFTLGLTKISLEKRPVPNLIFSPTTDLYNRRKRTVAASIQDVKLSPPPPSFLIFESSKNFARL